MSACNILNQRRLKKLRIMTDAAAYNRYTGELVDIVSKCHVAANPSCAVSSIGPFRLSEFIAGELDQKFDSFDDVVDGIEEQLPELFEEFTESLTHDCVGELYFAGWSARQDRPIAYATSFAKVKSATYERYKAESNREIVEFKLRECTLTANPGVEEADIRAAGLNFARDLDDLDAELDLLHLLEIQRRRQAPSASGGIRFWVGGRAELCTVTSAGIEQKTVHEWSEDKPGAVITPSPIDWQAWRNEQVRKRMPAARSTAGMSRLRREMAQKREAKQLKRMGAR